VGEWVESLAGTELSKRAAFMAAIEGSSPTPRPSERVRVPVSSTTSDVPTNPAIAAPKVSPKESEVPSDASHVAVAPTLPRPPRAWGRIALAASFVSVVLGGVLAAVLTAGPKPSTPAGPTAQPAPVDPAAESSQAVQRLADVPSQVAVDPSGSAVPSATSAKAHSPASAATARPRNGLPKADCATPFTIDDKGHKHYKAACL
jgi:hypothetical protein